MYLPKTIIYSVFILVSKLAKEVELSFLFLQHTSKKRSWKKHAWSTERKRRVVVIFITPPLHPVQMCKYLNLIVLITFFLWSEAYPWLMIWTIPKLNTKMLTETARWAKDNKVLFCLYSSMLFKLQFIMSFLFQWKIKINYTSACQVYMKICSDIAKTTRF